MLQTAEKRYEPIFYQFENLSLLLLIKTKVVFKIRLFPSIYRIAMFDHMPTLISITYIAFFIIEW